MIMLIKIKVVTKASQNKVGEKVGEYRKVYVTDPPEHGKANKTVISLIAKWLSVSKSKVKISSGFSSQIKTIEIDE